jgi:hypothetical protein
MVERQGLLAQVCSLLKEVAETYQVPILVTNQVGAKTNRARCIILFGAVWPPDILYKIKILMLLFYACLSLSRVHKELKNCFRLYG